MAMSLAAIVGLLFAADGTGRCQSGLEPGQRPGPYAAVISTGTHRGEVHCFICETADRPAVVIFARALSEPLGKLAQGLDKAVAEHKNAELRCWITFLHQDQLGFDPMVVRWSQQYALRNVPLGVFEDAGGPPSYRLAPDADITVLLFVKQRIVANFAFRPGELKDANITQVLQALPRIAADKK